MVSVFEEYSERVSSYATNIRERYELDTKSFILDNFDDSPTYREIEVYEQEESIGTYGVRVNMIERMGNIRSILLKPDKDLNVGNMTSFEGRDWLIFDKFGHVSSGVKVTAMRTNYLLKWIDRDGVLNIKRCYASSSDIGSKSKQSRANIEYNKYDVKLAYGQLYIFIEVTENTRRINLNHRFIINDIVYEVIGVDNTTHVEDGYGIIQYTVKRITRNPKDDFEFGIAHNNYLDKDIHDYDLSELDDSSEPDNDALALGKYDLNDKGRDADISDLSSPRIDDEDINIDLTDEKGNRKRGGSIW